MQVTSLKSSTLLFKWSIRDTSFSYFIVVYIVFSGTGFILPLEIEILLLIDINLKKKITQRNMKVF